MNQQKQFEDLISKLHEQKAQNSKIFNEDEYNELLQHIKRVRETGPNATNKSDYYLVKTYDLQKIELSYVIIHKRSGKIILHSGEYYDVIKVAHQGTGHGGRLATMKLINEKYYNITQQIVSLFIETCENCQLKRNNPKKGIVVKPIVSNHLNSRCQVDLIDLQTRPDGDYKFIFVYQDHLTKYVRLRALKTKTAKEVAENLLEVFADLGSPCVLQSDNGREFANHIIEELVGMWPECHIVHGKPRHSQSQGSVERANQDIENKLASWMKDNNSTKWSQGLKIVQFYKNRCFHDGIGRSPYEALYGVKCRDGLNNLSIPIDKINNLRTEEELEALISSSNDAEDISALDLHSINNNNNSESDDKSIGNEDGITIEELSAVIENADVILVDNKNTTVVPENQPTRIIPEINENANSNEVNMEKSQNCTLCTEENLCYHCRNKNNIQTIREECRENQNRQAEKMLQTSRKKFKPGAIGMSVRIPIPDVDRSRSDHRNILGVIMSVEEFYRIGTIHGVLKQLYSRNEFEICKQQFISLHDVKTDTEITLRGAAGKFSVSGSTQGYIRCQCKKNCINKKCKCLASGYTCNSKCHNSNPCSNK